MSTNLIAMKRSYKEPQEGDIFVVQPKKDLYYYGKVIQSKIETSDPSFGGWYLIFIYDIWTKDKKPDISLNKVPLLTGPMVVNKRPWTMGYLETIGRSPVTDYDLSIDYGFWDSFRKKHYDIYGNVLTRQPQCVGIYGLGSFGAISTHVHEALSRKA